MRAQQVRVVDAGGQGWVVLAPVAEGGEAIGLVELTMPVRPSAAQQAEVARTAFVLACVPIASRRRTNLFDVGPGHLPPLPITAEGLAAFVEAETDLVRGWDPATDRHAHEVVVPADRQLRPCGLGVPRCSTGSSLR